MRNRMTALFCIACLIMALTSCSERSSVTNPTNTVVPSSLENIPSSKNTKVVVEKGDSYYDPQSLEEVEDLTKYIVRGRILDDAKQKLERYGSKYVVFGVTVSSFEISHVYKGDLKEGDKIPIAERYYTLEENDVTTRFDLDYAPSVPNHEYIFFLIKDSDNNPFLRGFYSPVVKEMGRYPVIGTKDSGYSRLNLMTASELNLVQENPETYKKIYQQVIDKYLQ